MDTYIVEIQLQVLVAVKMEANGAESVPPRATQITEDKISALLANASSNELQLKLVPGSVVVDAVTPISK